METLRFMQPLMKYEGTDETEKLLAVNVASVWLSDYLTAFAKRKNYLVKNV